LTAVSRQQKRQHSSNLQLIFSRTEKLTQQGRLRRRDTTETATEAAEIDHKQQQQQLQAAAEQHQVAAAVTTATVAECSDGGGKQHYTKVRAVIPRTCEAPLHSPVSWQASQGDRSSL